MNLAEFDLRKAVADTSWSRVLSSASNGVQSVEQQVRVLKSTVEGRWGVKLETRHPAIPWITEHAAVLFNRFDVGRRGNRVRTHKEFGEAILWKRRLVGGALGKLSCLWQDGLYLGIRGQFGS